MINESQLRGLRFLTQVLQNTVPIERGQKKGALKLLFHKAKAESFDRNSVQMFVNESGVSKVLKFYVSSSTV